MTSFSKVGDPPLLIYGRTTLYAPKYGNGTKKVWLSKKAIKVAQCTLLLFFPIFHGQAQNLTPNVIAFLFYVHLHEILQKHKQYKQISTKLQNRQKVNYWQWNSLDHICLFSNVKSRCIRKDVTAAFYNGRHLLPYGF